MQPPNYPRARPSISYEDSYGFVRKSKLAPWGPKAPQPLRVREKCSHNHRAESRSIEVGRRLQSELLLHLFGWIGHAYPIELLAPLATACLDGSLQGGHREGD